jgi:tRNA-splicing ligase RtcB (3'-phosphate/5'-hydroxy nucleic acid ligase)
MTELTVASLRTWLAAPLPQDVAQAIDRLRRAPDVHHVAVMPDVHLAEEVCIGVVIATSALIYPQAVGGDIGCGMLAVAVDANADALRDPRVAAEILARFGPAIPPRRRHRRAAIAQPADLTEAALSDPRLEAVRGSDGILEFATLGSGNHFLELQADEDDRLWLMVHSGSRAMGQAIRRVHLDRAQPVGNGLRALGAASEAGADYLRDVAFARRFAEASRRAIAAEAGAVIESTLNAALEWDSVITTDHNHVALERHAGRDLLVHRKGAMAAFDGQPGVLPGSMGTASYHVEGRGCADALCSSAHGAGRALSRTDARRRFTERDLQRQMNGVWYDYRLAARLRDEAPGAYKDLRAVLRAQQELVKVTRVLRPVLNYKGA